MTAAATVQHRRTALDAVNPVTRLGLAVLVAIPILLTLDWVSASTMLALQVIIFRSCGVPVGLMARRLAPILLVAPLASISMLLYGRPGGEVYWQWWLITISHHSTLMAIAVFVRLLALALSAMILMLGVDPTDMADGLAQLVHLPARFVLGTLAGVRMLGLFANDWRTMGQARRARGLGDTGWLRRWATMAFALLVFAIRRGTKLATSMETRGFGAQSAWTRTWARPSRLTGADVVAILIAVAVCTASIGLAVWAGTFWFVGSEAPA